MFKLEIDRDSICIGDDVLSHKMTLELADDTSLMQLLKALEEMHYLPNMDHEKMIWSCLNNGQEITVYSGRTKQWSPYNVTVKDMCETSKDFLLVFLHFYSQEEWQRRLHKENN